METTSGPIPIEQKSVEKPLAKPSPPQKEVEIFKRVEKAKKEPAASKMMVEGVFSGAIVRSGDKKSIRFAPELPLKIVNESSFQAAVLKWVEESETRKESVLTRRWGQLDIVFRREADEIFLEVSPHRRTFFQRQESIAKQKMALLALGLRPQQKKEIRELANKLETSSSVQETLSYIRAIKDDKNVIELLKPRLPEVIDAQAKLFRIEIEQAAKEKNFNKFKLLLDGWAEIGSFMNLFAEKPRTLKERIAALLRRTIPHTEEWPGWVGDTNRLFKSIGVGLSQIELTKAQTLQVIRVLQTIASFPHKYGFFWLVRDMLSGWHPSGKDSTSQVVKSSLFAFAKGLSRDSLIGAYNLFKNMGIPNSEIRTALGEERYIHLGMYVYDQVSRGLLESETQVNDFVQDIPEVAVATKLGTCSSVQEGLTLIRAIKGDKKVIDLVKPWLTKVLEAQAKIFRVEIEQAAKEKDFNKFRLLLDGWMEIGLFMNLFAEKPSTVKARVAALFRRTIPNTERLPVWAGHETNQLFRAIGEGLSQIELTKAQTLQVIKVLQTIAVFPDRYEFTWLVRDLLSSWHPSGKDSTSEEVKSSLFAYAKGLSGDSLIGAYKLFKNMGIPNSEIRTALGEERYIHLGIDVYDLVLRGLLESETQINYLIQDVLEFAIGNKKLNAELHKRSPHLNKAEEILHQISCATVSSEDGHQPSLPALREDLDQLKTLNDCFDNRFPLLKMPFSLEKKDEITHILSSSCIPDREQYQKVLDKLNEMKKEHPEYEKDENFQKYVGEIEKLAAIEEKISSPTYKGILPLSRLAAFIRLAELSCYLKDVAFHGDKDHPRLSALFSDLSEISHLVEDISQLTSNMPGTHTGDVFLDEFKTRDLVYYGSAQHLTMVQALKEKKLLRAVERFPHAGVIQTKMYPYRFGITDIGHEFTFTDTLTTVRYRPALLSLLSEEAKTQLRKIHGWEKFTDQELEDTLQQLYRQIMEKWLEENEEKCKEIQIAWLRGAFSLIRAKTEKLPKPLQKVVNAVFERVIMLVLKKIDPGFFVNLKDLEETDKMFCSEYVVTLLREVFQKFHAELEREAGTPLQMKDFIPPEIEASAIQPGRLDQLLSKVFTKVEPPLWQRFLLGSQLS